MRLPTRPRRPIVPPDMMGMVSLAFLLLIFFLIAGDPAASLPQGVRPPVAGVMGRIDTAGTPLVLDADGRLFWQGQALADADLSAALAARPRVGVGVGAAGADTEALALAADGRADTVRVATVLALLRQAGQTRVKVLLTDAARANAFGRGNGNGTATNDGAAADEAPAPTRPASR